MTPPLHLLFDSSMLFQPGENGALRWGILNTSNCVIIDIQIELSCDREGLITVGRFNSHHRTVVPNKCEFFGQSLEVHRTGKFPLHVHVNVQLDNGTKHDLVSSTLFFTVSEANKGSRSINIEVEHEAIIEDIGDANDVNIKVGGSAILNFSKQTAVANAPIASLDAASLQVDMNKLVDIPICYKKKKAGLYPLDFEALVSNAPMTQGLSLHFVDAERRARTTTAVDSIYSLHINSQRSGYLSLFSRGSSGKYYVLAPNTVIADAVCAVSAGDSYFFPGHLLPLPIPAWPPSVDILTFGSAGTELALAVLSSTPLMSMSMEPCAELAPETLSQLLSTASAQSGTAFALAKIIVEKKQGQKW